MHRNLQIQDIVSQDDDEVVFCAIDEASGKTVWLYRFFPFGRGGRGLRDEERRAYETVVQALLDVSHPALCQVVAGGVDPVDGVPFVAIERVAGVSLDERLQQGWMRPSVVIAMMETALEVGAVLSRALGRDGLWVEMLGSAVVWTDPGEGNLPMFRISPLCCLWTGNDWQFTRVLAGVTEAVLGWQGGRIYDQDGEGLGAWVKWLRAHPVATIAGVREALAVATRRSVPLPPPGSNNPAPRPVVAVIAKPRRRSKLPRALAVACLVLAAASGGWWALQHFPWKSRLAGMTRVAGKATAAKSRESKTLPSAVAAQPMTVPATPPDANADVRTPVPNRHEPAAANAGDSAKERPLRRAERPPATGSGAGVLDVTEVEAIMARFHSEVTMEGELVRVSLSGNRKIWYLEFSRGQPADAARAFLPVQGDDPAKDLEQVQSLVGKRIRVRGMVDGEIVGPQKVRRPKVLMKGREALEVVE